MTKPFILDTIHETPLLYSGAEVDWEHTDRGKKPVIDKMSTSSKEVLVPGVSSVELFPYELTDKNIKRVSGVGKADIIMLKPTKDIPEYTTRDYRNSFYSKHMNPEGSQEHEELLDELEQLRQERNRLQKKVDEETSEEEEQVNQNSRSGPPMLECDFCDKTSRESDFQDGDKKGEGICPKCGQGTIENAKEVNN
jgi:hypothetical protein